jgi:hypothetical protein
LPTASATPQESLVSIAPDDPRQIGGQCRDGYWDHEYTVIVVHTFDNWRDRSIRVRQEELCVGIRRHACTSTPRRLARL